MPEIRFSRCLPFVSSLQSVVLLPHRLRTPRLGLPSGLHPAATHIYCPSLPPFTWAPSIHDTVQIQVSWRESDFSAIVIDTIVTGTSAVLDLGYYKTYYWRARYVLDKGFTSWSATLTFATDVEPRSIPFLQSPDDNAVGLPDSVVLIWLDPNNVMHMPDWTQGGPINYSVQVSADSTFPLRLPAEVSFGRFGETRVARPPYYFDRTVSAEKAISSFSCPLTRVFSGGSMSWEMRNTRRNTPGLLYRENSEWTPARSFRTMKKPPVSFAVTYPVDGAADVESTLTVRWHDTLSDSSDGFGYQIEMRSDSNFNRLDSAYNSYLGPAGRAPEWIPCLYIGGFRRRHFAGRDQDFWNLRKNASQLGPGLQLHRGLVHDSSRPNPMSRCPAIPKMPPPMSEPDPVLTWAAAPRASKYQVLISVDSTFADPLRRDTVTGTEFKEDSLKLGATYWWKVKAINGNGESEYSTARTFTTSLMPSTSISLTSLEEAWRAFLIRPGRCGKVRVGGEDPCKPANLRYPGPAGRCSD